MNSVCLRGRPILFLDFDGVLHPVSALVGFRMRLPREAAIRHGRLFRWAQILEDVLYPSNVGIVVHSSWRSLLPAAELQHLLGPLGYRFIDIASRNLHRWEGILAKVSECELMAAQWLILDDHGNEYPEPPPPQLVLCDGEEGVWSESVQVSVRRWWTTWAANQ